MAALVCIAYSVGVHFYRAGCVFYQSGGSLNETFNYLLAIRNEILDQEYLEHLDEIYALPNNTNQSNKQINRHQRRDKLRTSKETGAMSADGDICSDFIAIEKAEEATENGFQWIVSIDQYMHIT